MIQKTSETKAIIRGFLCGFPSVHLTLKSDRKNWQVLTFFFGIGAVIVQMVIDCLSNIHDLIHVILQKSLAPLQRISRAVFLIRDTQGEISFAALRISLIHRNEIIF